MPSNLNVKSHVAMKSTSLDNLTTFVTGAKKPFSLVKIVTLINLKSAFVKCWF